MELQEALRALADIRRSLALSSTRCKELDAKVKQTPEYQALRLEEICQSDLKQAEKEAYEAAKTAALEAFRATGDKNPALGANISLYTICVHDIEKERKWCAENMPVYLIPDLDQAEEIRKVCVKAERLELLTVDTKGLEAACKKMADAPFVRRLDPRPKIDADLSAWLPGKQEGKCNPRN